MRRAEHCHDADKRKLGREWLVAYLPDDNDNIHNIQLHNLWRLLTSSVHFRDTSISSSELKKQELSYRTEPGGRVEFQLVHFKTKISFEIVINTSAVSSTN